MKSGGVCDVSYPTSKLRRGRVQEGGNVSPTLTCSSGAIVRIEVMENGFFQQALETAERENAKPGDIVDAFNGRVHKDGISPTITTRPEGKKTAVLPVVEDKRYMEEEKTQETEKKTRYAIRKLTDKECFRLMNFSDEDYEKAKFKKEIFFLEGEKEKCNAKLKVVPEKQKHLNMETYVSCIINDSKDMEVLKTAMKYQKKGELNEKMLNVNVVIEKLGERDLSAIATNTIRCITFMGMQCTLMEEKDQQAATVIIVQGKKDKENTVKSMKISTELNSDQNKLYTILTLFVQIMQLKIFGSTTLKANIQGCIAITEDCENSIRLKISNLKMETTSTNVSTSQMYKTAGNSIVVAVLCAIFSQLGIQGHKKWNEMTLEERRALVYKGTILEAK